MAKLENASEAAGAAALGAPAETGSPVSGGAVLNPTDTFVRRHLGPGEGEIREMLAGHLPFIAREPLAVMQQQLSVSPPPLRLGRVAGRGPAMLGQHPPSTTPLQLASQVASTSPAWQLPKPDAVKAGLTPKRPRRQVENDEYSAFVRRILRAYARRVAAGDVEALTSLVAFSHEVETAIRAAIRIVRVQRLSAKLDRHDPGKPCVCAPAIPARETSF